MTDKCAWCGKVKEGSLEMVSVMTLFACYDCQKIPPAYRMSD